MIVAKATTECHIQLLSLFQNTLGISLEGKGLCVLLHALFLCFSLIISLFSLSLSLCLCLSLSISLFLSVCLSSSHDNDITWYFSYFGMGT